MKLTIATIFYHILLLSLILILLLEFIACSSNETKLTQNTVRDSLGVKIFENRVPNWNEEDKWQLSEQPVLEISDEAFYHIFAAIQMNDGTIVVANSGSVNCGFMTKGENLKKRLAVRAVAPENFLD